MTVTTGMTEMVVDTAVTVTAVAGRVEKAGKGAAREEAKERTRARLTHRRHWMLASMTTLGAKRQRQRRRKTGHRKVIWMLDSMITLGRSLLLKPMRQLRERMKKLRRSSSNAENDELGSAHHDE